jgi:hypothetical protein
VRVRAFFRISASALHGAEYTIAELYCIEQQDAQELLVATSSGSAEVVAMLLAAGAYTNAVNSVRTLTICLPALVALFFCLCSLRLI